MTAVMMALPPILAAAAGGAHDGPINLPAIILGIFLLVANGFFVAAEIAILAARRTRIEERADAGDARAELAQKLLAEISITFSGAQLGITMASLGLGAIAEPALATVIARGLGLVSIPESVAAGLAFALAIGIVVFLHMVVGEMAPKNLALARAEDTALRLARPFRAFVWLFRPVILLLNWMGNLLVRAVGVEPIDEHDLVHSPAELALALRESQREGTVTTQDARVLSAALELATIDAAAAMTPRTDLAMVSDQATATDVLSLSKRTGHSRFPVFHEDQDDVVGMMHVKDLLVRDPGNLEGLIVSDLLRPIQAVPESRDLEHLLTDMRTDRSHAVIVVDEFGSIIGLVTLEDVLEELVGEISDEFDEGEHVIAAGDREWQIDGLLRRDELQRLTGLRLPDGETETVNGFLMERLGRLPRRGDEVVQDGWRLQVVELSGRRAGTVAVMAPDEPAADESSDRRSDGGALARQ